MSRKIKAFVIKWSLLTWALIMASFLTPGVYANIIGPGSQNFSPTANPDDFVTVLSSATVKKGSFNLGIFADFAANTLPYFEEAGSDFHVPSRRGVNDTLLSSHLALGYGISRGWDLSINVPAVLMQSIKDKDHPHGEFGKPGITEIRIASKYTMLANSWLGLATQISANVQTTKDDPYYGKPTHPPLNIEFIVDGHALMALHWAANIGYRIMQSRDDELINQGLIEPYSNQVLASSALGLDLMPRTQLIAEVFAAAPQKKLENHSARHTTKAEALLGLKFFNGTDQYYHAGIGSELRHSISSPDWRLYFGMQWSTPMQTYHHEVKRKPERKLPVKPTAVRQIRPVKFDPQKHKLEKKYVIHRIEFKVNSAELAKPSVAYRELDELAKNIHQLAQNNKFSLLIIEGHSCSLGTKSYNQRLSLKRAQKIRSLLISRYHLPAQKIVAIGRGENNPIASNDTRLGREKNRRVEFKIYKDKQRFTARH